MRADELWTVNTLARNVARWTVACDKRLDRLMRYIHHNSDLVLKSVVGDKAEDCSIALFCDASFAGDLTDSKSTSGAYLAVFGPRTFVPITWFCKKQTAVSHSSTEAEVLSLDTSVRMEGLPTLELMEKIIEVFGPKLTPAQEQSIRDKQSKHLTQPQRNSGSSGATGANMSDVAAIEALNIDETVQTVPLSFGRAKLYIFEDDEAVIKMILKGRSPNLRYMSRTQRIDSDWLWERLRDEPGVCLRYVNTKRQIADMFTKGAFSSAQWKSLIDIGACWEKH